MTCTIDQSRVTLTNLKVAEFASEETLCFSATVLFDGVPVADASNDGRGGCTFLRPRKGAANRLAEAEAFAERLPALVSEYDDPKEPSRKLTIDITLDLLVDHIAGELHDDRRIRSRFTRDIANKVLYVRENRLCFLRGVKLKEIRDRDTLFASIRERFGPEVVILNELAREEAFALWSKHVVCDSG